MRVDPICIELVFQDDCAVDCGQLADMLDVDCKQSARVARWRKRFIEGVCLSHVANIVSMIFESQLRLM